MSIARTTPPGVGTARTVLICMALLLEGMSSSSINVQLGLIQTELTVADGLLSAIAGSFLVAYAAFLPVAGRLTDLRDPRRMFAMGVVLFGVGSVLCAVATDPLLVLAGRSVQGVGAALSAPAAMVLITRGHEKSARARAVALYGAMGAAGFSLGLVLPGLVVSIWGWRASFLVLVPIVLLTVLAVRGTPAAHATGGRVNLGQAVLLTGVLMVGVHALGGVQGDRRVLLVEVVVVAVALIVLRRTGVSIVPPSVARTPRLRQGCFVLAGMFAAVLPSLLVLSLALQHDGDLTPFEVSLRVVPQPIFFSVLAGVAARLLPRCGAPRLVAAGVAVMLGALTVLAFVLHVIDRTVIVLAAMAAVGTSLALVFPAITTWALDAVPADDRGTASGLLTASQNIGGAAGLALVAAAGMLPGPQATTPLAGPMLLCAGLLVLCLGGTLAGASRRAATSGRAVEPVRAGSAR